MHEYEALPTGTVWQEHPQTSGHEEQSAGKQQDEQLTRIPLSPLTPTICNSCFGVLNLGQNKWGEKKPPTVWDRGIREKNFSRHFFFSLADAGHCSQVWYVRHGPSRDCPAHRLQVRQLFIQGCHHHKRFTFAIYLVLICPHHAKHRQYYKTNKVILFICFPKPVIYCDQKSVTRILFGQPCLRSSFNCSITKEKVHHTSYYLDFLHNRGKQAQAQNNPRTPYKDQKNTEKLTFHMFKECKQKCHHTDMQKTGVTQTKRCQFSI